MLIEDHKERDRLRAELHDVDDAQNHNARGPRKKATRVRGPNEPTGTYWLCGTVTNTVLVDELPLTSEHCTRIV